MIKRENEIRNFIPKTFHKITASFELSEGRYVGVYQKPDFKKTDEDKHDRIDRLWDKEEAERIFEQVKQSPSADVTETKKRSPQSRGVYTISRPFRKKPTGFIISSKPNPPARSGSLRKAQGNHLPSTDSKALPEDYGTTCREILGIISGELSPHAQLVLQSNWVDENNKRIFNNKQISDHFAIIPTNTPPGGLDANELKIYNLILKRFISAFYPPAQWDVTVRTSTLGGHAFKTEGRVLVEPSWLSIYGKDNQPEITSAALTR